METPTRGERSYAQLLSPSRPASSVAPRRIGHIHVMTWKERIQIFLDGYGGVALETFDVLLSVVLVVISVIMSYEHPDLVVTGAGYGAFEVACTLVFTVNFLLHWFAADNRLTFLFTPMAMIDLSTIIPTFVTWFLRSLNVSILPVVRIIRVFRLLAVLRLYRIVRSYRGFDYELCVLIFMIFTVIFVAAGIFQILDEDYYRDNDLPAFEFHDAVYFVSVTISTVGYGDISPKTTASQFFVIAIICVVVTVIPRQVNRLWELSRLQHGYMHSYSIRKRGILNGGHVVVTGSISYESVSGFLAEFYRTRQGKVNMDVVILADQIPSERLLAGYLDELYHIERPSGYESGTRHVRRPLILLLVKRLPSDQDLENMSTLLPPNVFVERGVSQSVEDLLRVRAHLAKAVLMIPGNWKYHVDELRDETMDEVTEHLLNYQVIMSTLSLRTVQELHHEHLQRTMANSKSRMIVGASHEPTIACSVVKWHESLTYFALKSDSYTSRDSYETTRKDAKTVPVLPPKMGSRTQRIRHAMREATGRVLQSDPRQDLPLHFAPSYAAGEVFVDSALDTLLCQSFFNPYVIDLVRALAGDYYFGDHSSHATFASSMMEYFQPPRQSRASSSSAPRQTPSNTESRKESPHDDNGQADAMIEHPVLAVASISEELEGKSFVTIFQHALRQQVLVLGIYRRANDSHRGNTVPYVYTCPKSHAGVTVEHGDVLHVVTRRIPPIVIHFQEGIASH
ncbi:hypothetical protein Poli38472_007835 [Pythium oligandrum]|uniref:Uncharacterized protein n=1 Tax=Pythium oligandrum TaxID=41045 RepID=A0A8K1CSJ5_PYTOL|nr:hypothetical protein Poli38472_007835 [Pythium oligandrum]|eukprot:TMW68163.1 hypothetical protein Poli38472_007835 [Pythium oligandrum]